MLMLMLGFPGGSQVHYTLSHDYFFRKVEMLIFTVNSVNVLCSNVVYMCGVYYCVMTFKFLCAAVVHGQSLSYVR